MEALNKAPRPLSILVVDPHAGTAAAMAELLRGQGCVVLIALDRDSAREAVAGVVPDVVLVGVGSGPAGMHAYEFARELRRLTEKKPPLLVAMSSRRAADRRLSEAGFDLRLARPTEPGDLLPHLVAKLAEREAAALEGAPGTEVALAGVG